jgi:hypothetical protein
VQAAELTHELKTRTAVERQSVRLRIVAALGPLTVLAGIAWAVAQPYRLTLLHPHHQGFWWLLSEPPLFVIVVGIVFHRLVVPGLRRDLAALEDEER